MDYKKISKGIHMKEKQFLNQIEGAIYQFKMFSLQDFFKLMNIKAGELHIL